MKNFRLNAVAHHELTPIGVFLKKRVKFKLDKRYEAEDLLDVMNHYRHDWMNDLQVLFGYIQLNKADKLKAYVENLSDKLYRESLVSKLGVSELVAYLLLFRSKSRKLEIT